MRACWPCRLDAGQSPAFAGGWGPLCPVEGCCYHLTVDTLQKKEKASKHLLPLEPGPVGAPSPARDFLRANARKEKALEPSSALPLPETRRRDPRHRGGLGRPSSAPYATTGGAFRPDCVCVLCGPPATTQMLLCVPPSPPP